MAPTIHELPLWKRAVVRLAAGLVVAWLRTVRLEADADTARLFAEARPGTLFCIWHNQLFLAPAIKRLYRRDTGVAGLVSASKDGAWLAAFLRALDMRSVRGSSSKLGREALHAVVRQLKEGCDVAITPDGPRGPAYSFEGGPLVAARRAQVPVLLVGCVLEKVWRVDSWDGFFLPRPFSRVQLRAEPLPETVLEAGSAGVPLAAERLLKLSAENEIRFRPPPRMIRRTAEAAARQGGVALPAR